MRFCKILFVLFIIAVGIVIPNNNVFAQVSATEYINNYLIPKQQYNTMVTESYMKNNDMIEYVNPQTGELTLSTTDYELQGRNSLNLKITTLYKGSETNIHEYFVTQEGNDLVEWRYSDNETTTFYEDRYNLGIGRRFSFPTIEKKVNSDSSSYLFLHSESGQIYSLQSAINNNGVISYPIENYPLKDMEIREDTSYTNGQTDGVSKYVLIDKNGEKTYFADDGRILAVKDRYQNTIQFQYKTHKYRIFESDDNATTTISKRLISKIIDTVGREVNIDYHEGKLAADGIYDTIMADDSDFSVIIYLPDNTPNDLSNNKTIIYNKRTDLQTNHNQPYSIRTIVDYVIDVDNEIKYHYNYFCPGYEISDIVNPGIAYCFFDKSKYVLNNAYVYLGQIEYYKINKLKRFYYDYFTKRLNGDGGSIQFWKVTKQQELEITDNNPNSINWLDEYLFNVKKEINYSYNNEFDGYRTAGYSNDTNYLKNTYRYSSESIIGSSVQRYVFDGKGELLSNSQYEIKSYSAAKVKYEAEDLSNTLTGLADRTSVPDRVRYIGSDRSGGSGKLKFNNVNVSNAGLYKIKINYYSSDFRQALISVNGATGEILNFPSKGSWSTLGEIEYTVSLNVGNNTIEILNDDWFGPDLDSITIAKSYTLIGYSTFSYDVNEQPLIKERTDIINGISNKKTENFEYDIYGNMIKYTGTMASRDANGNPTGNTYIVNGQTVNEFTSVYTYDNSKFNKLTSKTWKQDNGTNTSTSYVLDETGNVVKEVKNHIDGGVDKSYIIRYTYDSYGNMTSREIFNSKDVLSTPLQTTYYEFDSVYQNAYLTKEYYGTTKTDIDTYKKYTYDFYKGLKTSDIEGKTPSGGGTAIERTTSFTYDDFNRTSIITYPDNTTKNMFYYNDYYFSNRTVCQEDGMGNRIELKYDILGNLLSKEKQVPLEGTSGGFLCNTLVAYEYDQFGNPTKVIDSNGNSIRYAYDSSNRILTKTFWDKDTTLKEGNLFYYEAVSTGNNGIVISVMDEEGYIKRNTFDKNDKLVKVETTSTRRSVVPNDYENYATFVVGNNGFTGLSYYTLNSYTLDHVGNLISSTDSLNHTINYEYNDLGKLVKEKDAKLAETLYVYNNLGQILSKTQPGGKVFRYEYDSRCRLKSEEIYDSTKNISYFTEVSDYFDSKNIKSIKKGYKDYNSTTTTLSSEINYEYNVLGLMTDEYRKIDASNKEHIKYDYDANGNKKSIIEYANLAEDKYIKKNFVYNYKGKITEEEGFVQNVTQQGYYKKKYSYDNNDNLLQQDEQIDSSWLTTKYTYDYRNRLKSKVEPYTHNNTKTTTYDYDKKGNLISKNYSRSGKNLAQMYEYDAFGHLICKTDEEGNSTRFVYDLVGNKTREISPKFYTKSAEIANPNIINTLPAVTFEYDECNRLVKSYQFNGTSSILTIYREYDQRGNVTKEVDGEHYNSTNPSSSLGSIYTYNVLNKIDTVTTARTQEYNQLYSDSKFTKKLTYDGEGRIKTEIDAVGSTFQYNYTLNGLLKEKLYPGANRQIDTSIKETYSYDLTGKLEITHFDQKNNKTQILNNVFGKPYKKIYADNTFETFTYDMIGNLKTYNDRNENTAYYSYFDNGNLEERKVPLEKDAQNNILYSIEKYEYDEAGNVIKKTVTGTKNSTQVRETTYTYKDNNLLETQSNNYGGLLKCSYDPNGNIIKTETLRDTDVYDVSLIEYDLFNKKIKEIQLVDESDIYNASSMTNIASLRDSNYPGKIKLITGYEYDKMENITKKISPEAYAYLDSDGTNRSKYTTNFVYDAGNKVKEVQKNVKGSTVTIQYLYDAAGNVKLTKNEKGYYVSNTYDQLNRMLTITYPETDANLKSLTDTLKIQIVKGDTNTLAKSMIYGYDTAGNKDYEENAKGYVTKVGYDSMNRLSILYAPYDKSKANDSSNPYTRVVGKKVYDSNGNLIKDIDAKGYLSGTSDSSRYGIEYTYNCANKIVIKNEPEQKSKGLGFTEKYEYNQFGELIKRTNALNNIINYEYNNIGNLTKVYYSNISASYDFTFDKNGNKITSSDGRKKTTTYTYGNFGLIKKITDAENRIDLFNYSMSKNLTYQKDKNNNETTFTFNNLGELTQKKVIQTNDIISYDYDISGNRSTMTDESGSTSYQYDANNRLYKVTKDGVDQLTYNYDANGNTWKITDKKSNITEYGYDTSNRMNSVKYTVNSVVKTVTYDYDENGNRKTFNYYGGVKESYTYDRNNRLISLANTKPDGSSISNYSYTYYDNNLIKTKVDSYGTTTYEYDEKGRIYKEIAPGKTSIYSYDESGNRLTLDVTHTSDQLGGWDNSISYRSKSIQYSYTDTNRLTDAIEKLKNSSGTEVMKITNSYKYDNNGNQTFTYVNYTKPTGTGQTTSARLDVYEEGLNTSIDSYADSTQNIFDGFNRLKKAEVIKSGVASTMDFTYNGDDLRVKKISKKSSNNFTPVVTNYLYDDGSVIMETDATDTMISRYIRGLNYIARVDSANKHSYFLYNGHGDVMQTVSESGTIENQYDYDIWGTPTLAVEAYSCSIRYAGEFLDVESGNYYLRARFYSPAIGRFITQDTYEGKDNDPLSLNLYTYCHNNPISYIDPTGHSAGYLEYGTTGPAVKWVQGMLLDLGYSLGGYGATGNYLTYTERAVKQFQAYYGISQTGKVGNQTLRVMETVVAMNNSGTDIPPSVYWARIEQVKRDFGPGPANFNRPYYSAESYSLPSAKTGDTTPINERPTTPPVYSNPNPPPPINQPATQVEIDQAVQARVDQVASNEQVNGAQVAGNGQESFVKGSSLSSIIYAPKPTPSIRPMPRSAPAPDTKNLDPNQTLIRDDWVDILQNFLEGGGMIPVLGEPFDGVNGIIYYARGDKVSAALSMGSMIPVIGNGITGVKWIKKGSTLVGAIPGTEKAIVKGSGGKLGGWDMQEGGGVINGRKYSQHSLERMAPDTMQVRAELEARAAKAASEKGLQTGTKAYSDFVKKYVDPRNIPPSVIEDAIQNTKSVPGKYVDTFVHETSDVTVIVNGKGDVVTVIPK